MPSYIKPYQKFEYIISQHFSENIEKLHLAITDVCRIYNLRFNK